MDRGKNQKEILGKPLPLLLLLGLGGFLIYFLLGPSTFEWAKLDLEITRSDAIEKSRTFLQERGEKEEALKFSARFWTYDKGLIYLQRTLNEGERLDLLERDEIPVWGWSVRAMDPTSKLEHRIWWSPKGKLLGFYSELAATNLAFPSLIKEEALLIASLEARRLFPEEYSSYQLADHQVEEFQGSREHTIRFEKTLDETSIRKLLHISVVGSKVRSARLRMELPSSFLTQEKSKAHSRTVLSNLFFFVNKAFLFVVILFLIFAWKRSWIRWRKLFPYFALIVLAKGVGNLNEFPLLLHQYNVGESWISFWTTQFFLGFFEVFSSALWVLMLLAAADALGRILAESKYSLGETTTANFFRSRDFVQSSMAGFSAAGLQLGFVVLYYFVGTRFLGFYSPQDIPFDNLLATKLPWIQPLLTGLEPALTEEALYRLFAIPLVFLVTRKKSLAIILPALLWGFLHTTYYVDPIYARGLELFTVGVFFGWIFWKYGIWSTLVAHYVYNTTVSSSLLFSSDQLFLRTMAVLVIGLAASPMILALWSFLKRGSFEKLSFSRLNWSPRRSRKEDLERRNRSTYKGALPSYFAKVLFLISLPSLLLIAPFLHLPELDLGRKAIAEKAVSTLNDLGLRPDSKGSSIFLREPRTLSGIPRKEDSSGYLAGLTSEDPIWMMQDPEWAVKVYTKELETYCHLDFFSSGILSQLYCPVDSDLSGTDDLSGIPTAEELEDVLKRLDYDLEKFSFLGISSTKEKARRDYEFSWIDPRFEAFELRRTITLEIVNGNIAAFDSKLSRRKRHSGDEKSGFREKLPYILSAVFLLIGIFLVLRTLFRFPIFREGRYRIPFRFGVFGTGVMILKHFNDLPRFWFELDVGQTPMVYIFGRILEASTQVATMGVITFSSVFLFSHFAPRVFDSAPDVQDFGRILKRWPWQWRGSSQGILWSLAIVSFQYALRIIFKNQAGLSLVPIEYPYLALSGFFAIVQLAAEAWVHWIAWICFGLLLASLKDFIPWIFRHSWAVLSTVAGLLLAYFSLGDLPVSWITQVEIMVLLFFVLRFIRFHLPFFFWFSLIHLSIPFILCLTSADSTILWQGLTVLLAVGGLAFRTWWQTIRYHLKNT